MKRKSLLSTLTMIMMIVVLVDFTPLVTTGFNNADDGVTVTPETPYVGDTLVIQYDTSVGALSTDITSLYLQWAFIFYGNYDENQQKITPVPPAKAWYPQGVTSTSGFAGRYLSTPMENVSDTVWEIQIPVVDDMPDQIQFYFTVNANGVGDKDNNDGNYWYITPVFSSDGIYIIDPSVAETNFYRTSDTLTITVRGPDKSLDWEASLAGRSDEPIPLTISSSTYDTDTGEWTLVCTFPQTIDVGLYDLVVSATDSTDRTWTDIEENSVQILDSFKDEYTIILLGDQEMNNHGVPEHLIDGTIHQGLNMSDLLTEMSIFNADMFVNLGSATFWGDIETMLQYREFVTLFYDLPHIYVASHRDRFMGSEADWPYTGAGIGALEKLVGIRHKEWIYGDHYFISIFTGDHRMDDSEVEWFDDADWSGNVKFGMIHDPIGYETDYNPSGINAIDSEGRALLAPICKKYGLDYWIHSSAGIDGSQEVSETGAFHIGTSGATSGYRVLKISGDEIVDWGYGDETDAPYPWNHLSVNFNGNNDGSQTTLAGTVNNSLAEDLPAARIVFKMSPGVYSVDKGTIYSQYTKDDITYVEVNVPVSANSLETVTATKTGDLPTSTTEAVNTTDESTSLPETSASQSPAFELALALTALISIYIFERKKRKN